MLDKGIVDPAKVVRDGRSVASILRRGRSPD